jgi:hypothetical protein
MLLAVVGCKWRCNRGRVCALTTLQENLIRVGNPLGGWHIFLRCVPILIPWHGIGVLRHELRVRVGVMGLNEIGLFRQNECVGRILPLESPELVEIPIVPFRLENNLL